MDVVDLLVTIVVVTILVTIVLAVATYVAYKLRLSREPAPHEDEPGTLRYWIPYPPPTPEDEPPDTSLERLARDVASREGHASEA